MRDAVSLDAWQRKVEETYKAVPASCRPKKGNHKPRSMEKHRAMAISCKKAWDEWIKTGFLVVTEEGFKLCPKSIG